MSRKGPSETEYRVLEAFYQSSVNGVGTSKPRTSELAGEFGITAAAVAKAKRRLKDRHLLTESDDVTTAGYECLRSEVEIIQTEFPLAGEVQAGEKESNDLVVNMVDRAEFMDPNRERLVVPSNASPSNTIAFRVRGASMEDHNIFDGDYVLVELFHDGGWPREGELVVTHYLSPAFNNMPDEFSLDNIENNELEGPTIKYYYQRENLYRLSPIMDPDKHESTIFTRNIRPVGKVVGVYRQI